MVKIMFDIVEPSDELINLSKELLKTIEKEDKEYEFRKKKGIVVRNVRAKKYHKNIMGIRSSEFNSIAIKNNNSRIARCTGDFNGV